MPLIRVIEKQQKENKIQLDLLKGEIDHNLNNIGNYKGQKYLWKPYLIHDV